MSLDRGLRRMTIKHVAVKFTETSSRGVMNPVESLKNIVPCQRSFMTRMCNKCHSPEARGIGSEASPASHREETTDSEAPHVTSPSSNVRCHKRFLDMGHNESFRKENDTARHDINVDMYRYTFRKRYILHVSMGVYDHTCACK